MRTPVDTAQIAKFNCQTSRPAGPKHEVSVTWRHVVARISWHSKSVRRRDKWFHFGRAVTSALCNDTLCFVARGDSSCNCNCRWTDRRQRFKFAPRNSLSLSLSDSQHKCSARVRVSGHAPARRTRAPVVNNDKWRTNVAVITAGWLARRADIRDHWLAYLASRSLCARLGATRASSNGVDDDDYWRAIMTGA